MIIVHLFSVAKAESLPSEDTTLSQVEVTPITTQRKRELEHYLKLKRYKKWLFFLTEEEH